MVWWPPSTQAGVVSDLEAIAGAEVLDAWALTEGLVRGNDVGLNFTRSAYYDNVHFNPSVVGELGAALFALLAREP